MFRNDMFAKMLRSGFVLLFNAIMCDAEEATSPKGTITT